VLNGVAGSSLLVSALSKESGLIFLILWLALLVAQKKWNAFRAAAVVIAFVVVSYLSLRLPAEHIPPPSGPVTPALVRPILVARAFAEYAGLILLPLNLHMERDVETRAFGLSDASITGAAWRELQTLAGIILIAAFVYWLIRERKRDHAVFLLLLLAALSYLPVSGIFPLNASAAEHWLYLPTSFLFLGIALKISRQIQAAPARIPLLQPIAISVLCAWLLFLGRRTFMRTFDWKDQRTFLTQTMANGGRTARMLINLAGLEMSEGHLDEAKDHLQEALRKEPDQPLGVVNLAAVAIKQNDFPLAHEMLNRAKAMPLVEAQAYELMTVLENKETGHANMLRMRLAARTGVANWAIEKRYVKVLDESGASTAAVNELRSCLAQQWYRADSWQLLSDLLTKSGHATEAAIALGQAQAYDVHLGEHPLTP
jgi:tetratricopeptide (TPR) repeat protein